MVHLVYCDNKEKVLEKILDGSKIMVIRTAAGRKIPHSRVFIGENVTLTGGLALQTQNSWLNFIHRDANSLFLVEM